MSVKLICKQCNKLFSISVAKCSSSTNSAAGNSEQQSKKSNVDSKVSRFVESVDESTYNWRKDLNVRDQRFVDHVVCNAKGGTSGSGLEKFGGVGGDGGDVFLLADTKTKFVDQFWAIEVLKWKVVSA